MLKIGDFSRLARVSVKKLRFYAAAGVFAPAHVQQRTGYRFYRAAQLPQLRRVLLLRELGCSLAETAQLTKLAPDSPAATRALELLRARLMTRLARDEERLRRLDALLHARPRPAPRGAPVALRALEPVGALTLRARVRAGDTEVQRMFETAERRVARHGCRAPLSPFLLFHDMEYREHDMDVEVCIPVAAQAVGACGGRIVPGAAQAACARFAGSYAQAAWPVRTPARMDGRRGHAHQRSRARDLPALRRRAARLPAAAAHAGRGRRRLRDRAAGTGTGGVVRAYSSLMLRKSTPSERSLRYRWVRSMPTRLAS
jgi:DNA-binding transcriptional MerR regulator